MWNECALWETKERRIDFVSEKRGSDWENVAGRVGVCQVGWGEARGRSWDFRESTRCKACSGRVIDAEPVAGQALTLGCPRAPGQGASHTQGPGT